MDRIKVCSSVLVVSETLERDVEFEVVGEAPDKAPAPQINQEEVNSITNGNKDSAQPSTSSKGQHHFCLLNKTSVNLLHVMIPTHSLNYLVPTDKGDVLEQNNM